MFALKFVHYILLGSLIVHLSFLGGGRLGKAFEALKKSDYEKAKELFEKSIRNFPSVANYGLSILHSIEETKYFDLEKSFELIRKSELIYSTISESKKMRSSEYQVNEKTIVEQKNNVYGLLLNQAIKEKKLEAIRRHITQYPESPFIEKADSVVYNLAFSQAEKTNTSKAFKTFIEQYSKSPLMNAAKKKHEDLVLQELEGQPISAYKEFVAQNFGTPIAEKVSFRIFEQSVKNGSEESIAQFISENRFSPYRDQAWEMLIEMNFTDFNEKEEYQFVDRFPSIPKKKLYEYKRNYQIKSFPMIRDGKFGLLNQSGEELIPFRYEEICPLKENRAIVRKNNRYGFSDHAGKEVIEVKYDSAQNFERGLSIVRLKNKYGIINRKGDLILPLVYDQIKKINKNMFAVQEGNNQWALHNRAGPRLNDRYFNSIDVFSNGYAIASNKNGQFGIIDKEGNFLITPEYDSFQRLSNGNFIVSKQNKFGILSKKDTLSVPLNFDWLGNESEKTLVASDSGMVWLVDMKGNQQSEQKFPTFNNFKAEMKLINGLLKMKKDSLYGMINKIGKVIIDFKYDEIINEFGFPIAVKYKGKWGYLNKEYLQASAYEYEEVKPFIKGYAVVKKNKGYTIINKTGVEQLKVLFDELDPLFERFFLAKKNNKFGIIDAQGNELIPLEFDSIRLTNDNLYLEINKKNVLDYFNIKTKKFLFNILHPV